MSTPVLPCAIAVMAKAPQPGRSKTRLTSVLTPEQAATLSAAFLRDVTENIAAAARLAQDLAAPAAARDYTPFAAPATAACLETLSADMPSRIGA